jgi:hypothetical protein
MVARRAPVHRTYSALGQRGFVAERLVRGNGSVHAGTAGRSGVGRVHGNAMG